MPAALEPQNLPFTAVLVFPLKGLNNKRNQINVHYCVYLEIFSLSFVFHNIRLSFILNRIYVYIYIYS